jgi:hypothetical protein
MRPNEDVRRMLDHIADRIKRCHTARNAGESEVSIFFAYNGNVLTTGTPSSMAEHYGVYGHATFWKNLQRNGIVPLDVEYDEVPRGRVECDRNERKFHVYADPCILKDRKALDEIDREFHLSSANTQESECDPHYRCLPIWHYQRAERDGWWGGPSACATGASLLSGVVGGS